MRRFVAIVAVALTGLLTVAAPSAAAPGDALSRTVTGTFTGQAAFEFYTQGCSFVFQTYDLTFQAEHGAPGTLDIEGCVNYSSATGGFAFERGTFTLTLHNGATLSGTVSGGVFPMDLTLTVTDGTRRFRRATGTIEVDGPSVVSGPLSGTLSGSLQRS